jgi:cytochrome oxidase Cu insertion factor (SCO1/SenC/PrrC family)
MDQRCDTRPMSVPLWAVAGGRFGLCLLSVTLVGALFSACAAAAPTKSLLVPLPSAPEASDQSTARPARPQDAWRTAALRDVRSGETLVINDLGGRLVIIEPMATWCTNCRQQQNEAREALDRLDRDDIVYISLEVDPGETEAGLAAYADQHDYRWHFVVGSTEVLRSLAEVFGDQVLSPPSTPEVIVSPDGDAEISFGLSRADELEARFLLLLP